MIESKIKLLNVKMKDSKVGLLNLLLTWGEMGPAAPKSGVSSLKKKVPRGTMAHRSEDDSDHPVTQAGGLAGLTV